MEINWNSILGKVKNYIASDDGQQRVKNAISGGAGGVSNSDITNHMIDAANKLIGYIQNEFYKSYPYGADSVRDIIDNDLEITMMPVEIGKGKSGGIKYRIDVGFHDESALHRNSLRKSMIGKQRTGKGIDNIISLFDTGGGSKVVHGYWDGREDYNSNNGNPPYITTPVPVFSQTGFMLAAVESFNRECGDVYSCVATISAPDPRFYIRK